MKCHPLRWIWGLIPLLLLSYLATLNIRGRVETDLTQRTTEALQAAGLGWAKVKFDGRDGLLSGQAADENEPGKAIELASGINGVRIFDGKADLLKKVDPYTWAAELKDGRVRLTGFVPNETTRKHALSAAKSAFPQSEIEDRLELARGNPPAGEWLDAMRFSLKELAQTRHGRVSLSGLLASIHGEATSPASYRTLSAAYNTGLPKALKLGTFAVAPPVIQPYQWRAKYADGKLTLTGFVPSEQEQVELLTHAKRAFPSAMIVDKLELGSGAPENFGRASRAGLAHLANLQQGSVELLGDTLSIEGDAADDRIAETTKRAFKGDTPANLKAVEAIRGLNPVAKPYTVGIEATSSIVELTGFVPSEQERVAVLAAAKKRFPGREIQDRLKIAGGDPAGYDTCVTTALKALGRLGAGRAGLSDRALEISGVTQDEALAKSLASDVSTEGGAACDSRVKVSYDDSVRRKEEAEREAREKAERERAAQKDAERRAAEKDAEEARRVAQAEEQKAAAVAAESRNAAESCQAELRSTASNGVINFETASDVLSRESLPTLRALAEAAQRCKNVLIEISGHTDNQGHPERQQPLSERRAQAVANFLIDQGVDAAHIRAVGYGDTRPLVPNDSPENWAKNRRIEFSVKLQ